MQLSSSNLYKHSGYQCKISPNGSYLANSVDNRLVIRKSAADLTILHVFDCLHLIKHVEWSPDSRYVMTANYQTATIQVWSVTNTHWRSKIHDASFGITRAWWGPASQSIICSSELSLRLSVWMLKENRVIYMKYPKFTDKGCEVSPDGKYLAVIENRSGKDCISVYTAPDIQLVKHFQLDTEDVANIRWSPNSHYIAAWDNCLYYKLVIYRPDGHLCASYQAYGEGLGIKSICWSRDSQLLAVGSYDQKVRILRTCSWDPISELFHAAAIKQLEYSSASIYRELQRTSSTGPVAYDHIVRRPVNIPILRPEYSASNPKTGVGMCQFNANGHLLCTRDDGIPTTLWVWDTTKFQCLYIIMQQRAIKQVAWHPTNPNMLTFTCDTNTLYIVTILLDLDTNGDSTARRIQISPVAGPSGDFVIRKFRFVPDGSSVLLMDKTLFGLISIS